MDPDLRAITRASQEQDSIGPTNIVHAGQSGTVEGDTLLVNN